jgi:hypothetical protein
VAKITIPYSDLTGADKVKLFRLFSLKFAGDATLDPSLAGQFSAGQIAALQGAIDIAFLSVQDNTAPPLGYSPEGQVKIQPTPSGNSWFSLEYKNSFGTNIDALDARVIEIDVRILDLEAQKRTELEQRAIVQASLDAGDSLDEVAEVSLRQVSREENIQVQIEALNNEKTTLLELKIDLES